MPSCSSSDASIASVRIFGQCEYHETVLEKSINLNRVSIRLSAI